MKGAKPVVGWREVEGWLRVAFRPSPGGECHSLKLLCTWAVVPAMTLQSLLQEVTETVMLAAFPFRVLNPVQRLLQVKQLSRLSTWTHLPKATQEEAGSSSGS